MVVHRPFVTLRSKRMVGYVICYLLVLWINVVDKGVDRLCEVIGGANVLIRFGGRLRGEVSSRREIVIADVGDENVLAVLDGLLFVQGNIRIAAGLIQSMTFMAFFLRAGVASTKAAAAACTDDSPV